MGVSRLLSVECWRGVVAHCFPFLIVAIKNTRSQEALATGRLYIRDGFPVVSDSWDSHHLLLGVPSPELIEAGIVDVFSVFRIHGDVLEYPISGPRLRCFSFS